MTVLLATPATGSGSTASVTLPTWSVGSSDVVLVGVAVYNGSPSTPTGWTQLAMPGDGNYKLAVYAKTATAADSGSTVNIAVTNAPWAVAARIYPSTTVDITSADYQTSNPISSIGLGAFTASAAPCTAVAFYGGGPYNAAVTFTPPTGYGNGSQASTGGRKGAIGSSDYASSSTAIAAQTVLVAGSTIWGGSVSVSLLPAATSTVPGAPTGVTAVAGNGQATVSWTAPASNGGSAITSYTVTASPGGATQSTANGSTTSLTFTGLSNGTAYTFTVHATNSVGNSAESAPSGSVTPTASISGTIAQTLPHLTQSASGSRTVPAFTGTVAQTFPALTESGSGSRTVPSFTGTVTQTFPPLTEAASGTVAAPAARTATIAQSLPHLTQAAAGTRSIPAISGTVGQTLPALTQTLSGSSVATHISGTVGQSFPAFTQDVAVVFHAPATAGSGGRLVVTSPSGNRVSVQTTSGNRVTVTSSGGNRVRVEKVSA